MIIFKCLEHSKVLILLMFKVLKINAIHATGIFHLYRYMATINANQVNRELMNYHIASDKYLEEVENWLLDNADGNKNLIDVYYESGVLSIKTINGAFVLNKQPPIQQLWLSSYLSGPLHFKLQKGKFTWVCTKSESELTNILAKDLEVALDISTESFLNNM